MDVQRYPKQPVIILTGKEAAMTQIWSKPIGLIEREWEDYWEYYGSRLVEHAGIFSGAKVLDVACGTGSSLFPAAKKAGQNGYVVGFDICPG
jgi:2-polyprenyl-3-methyl-5-hydroxy-6-metoxy-1,4-benzoquinol methylase